MLIKSGAIIEKSTKLADGEVEFVVSTNALDAHGERINVDGIDLKDFKKNPVVLYGHDGFNLPIATATKIWKEAGKLMARAKFFLDDAFSSKVYDYIVKGRLNAVSIGGMIEEWNSDGITIDKMIMKEFSVVTIPANQEALVAAKSLGDDEQTELTKLANAYARKMLSQYDGASELQKNISYLENLVATLKEVPITGETDSGSAKDNITNLRVVLRQAQAVDKQAEVVIKLTKSLEKK